MRNLLAIIASHAFVYFGLCLAYFEAALESFARRNRRCACREVVIAGLYCIAAVTMLITHA
jgi:hypothetical protein